METDFKLENIGTIRAFESPVQRQLREYKEQKEKEKKEATAKANKFKLFLLKSFLSIRGYFRSLKYKKNATYHGGRNDRDAIYMGNNTFYEQISMAVPGFCYFNNKPIKYKFWELGYFKWDRITAKIEKNNVSKVF